MNDMGFFLLFLLYFFWTFSFPLGKMAVTHSDPIFFTALRMLLAGSTLTFYLWWKKSLLRLDRKALFGIFLMALGPIYLTNILEFWSLSKIPSSKVCFIYSLCPFMTALLSYVHLGEKMTKKKFLGMAIGFIGFLPIIFGDSSFQATTFFTMKGPETAMVFAALFSVYGFVIMKKLMNQKISFITINSFSMLIGGFFCILHSFFTSSYHPLPIEAGMEWTVLSLAIALMLISNILCYNLYGYLLRRFTTTLLSFAGLISPFFASLHGYVLLGENPQYTLLGCMGIIAIGLWLVYQEDLKVKSSLQQHSVSE